MRKFSRNNQIIKDVDSGLQFKELTEKYGLSYTAISQLYKKTKLEIDVHGDLYGLDTRIVNALRSNGIKSESEAYQGVILGVIYPSCYVNYGKKLHTDLCKFLGIELETPQKNSKAIQSYIKFLEKNGYQVTLK